MYLVFKEKMINLTMQQKFMSFIFDNVHFLTKLKTVNIHIGLPHLISTHFNTTRPNII